MTVSLVQSRGRDVPREMSDMRRVEELLRLAHELGYPRCCKGCHSVRTTGSRYPGASGSGGFSAQTDNEASTVQPGQAGGATGPFRRGRCPAHERLVKKPHRP